MAFNPYFIQATFEVMQSEFVLGRVVTNLNLNESWSKKYFSGEPIATSQICKRIRQRLRLAPVQNTKIVSISYISDDPKEAAQIANAIAEGYKSLREEERQRLRKNGLISLQKQYDKEENEIQTLRTNLNLLHAQLKISADSTNSSPEQKPYEDKMQKLEQLKKQHKLLYTKIQAEKADTSIHQSPVQIIDFATPPISPINPNRYIGGALLLAGLVLAAFGIFSFRD